MKFNFSKITSVLTSAVMISSTIGLAAAANFPSPFVQNGSPDVAVVYGTNSAANTDLAAVADIQSVLSAELAEQTASGDTETTVTGGDSVRLAKSSNELNLGNTLSGVFGVTVDDDDLEDLLADGVYTNDENEEFEFEQKITLAPLTLEHFSDSSYNDKEPTIGFHLKDNTFVLNYTLDFTTDVETDLDSSGDWADIETTDLPLFGKLYYVSSADNDTLLLLDSAVSGVVEEGETVTVSGHDISVHSLTTSEARLNVDGEITNDLEEGQSFKLSDGTYIGIRDIFQRDVAGVIGSVEFSLGSGKLEIVDGQDIELNDDSIQGVKGYIIKGTPSGGKERLNKIVIEWKVDDEMFVTSESSLVMPGFGTLKLSMGQFFTPDEEEIVVDFDGDDSIEISAPIKDGTARFNILGSNATGDLVKRQE